MKLNYSFIVLLMCVLTSSCDDDFAFDKQYCHVSEENLKWVTGDSIANDFIMTDNNGISVSYSNTINYYYHSQSTSSFLWINTDIYYYDVYNLKFGSTYRNDFSVELQAGYENMGDRISVNLYKLQFYYDFKIKELYYICLGTNNISSYSYLDESIDENLIKSTIEIIDSISINNTKYFNVLHFKLNDFKENIDLYSPTEVFYAQNIGLVKYVLADTLEFIRN